MRIVSKNLVKKFNDFVSEYRVPMFIDESLEPVFVSERGDCRYRVIVISVPKAGTYLLSELLKELGLVSTGLHIVADGSGFTDYRFVSVDEGRRNYRNYVYKVPFDQVVKRVKPGQFIVGHLHCNDYTKGCLQNFKKIFIVRELRHCLISHMRFLKETGREDLSGFEWHRKSEKKEVMASYLREYGKIFYSMVVPLMDWMGSAGTLVLRFEDILAVSGVETAKKVPLMLKDFLRLKDGMVDLRKFLFRKTLTWSGKLSSLKEYWSDEAEAYFEEFGFDKLNKFFGY
ncbi:MAG: hypothetical protein DRP88_04870 [Candidatus Neomarinimicrobiota bacterium]|nr:MAG: hypothetical protein DRP88_04870 [Candidatus Neomarinimicrobiota bacterium]